MVKELVVVSGKGGTGKTSIVAAFATLAEGKVLADCDVDAADLHLILKPQVIRRESFTAGKEARIRATGCIGCGACEARCRFGAISRGVDGRFAVDPLGCEGCGVCAALCPVQAIDFAPRVSGECFISETRHGPMAHARLGIAEENSGKLVTLVRKRASQLAVERGCGLVVIDGPPGIGCPVIASIGGTSLVLIVTEPTVSGLHDMERVAQLAAHFKTPAMICINKSDLNRELAATMRARAEAMGLRTAGEIAYDPVMTRAQIAGQSVIEFDRGSRVAVEVAKSWTTVLGALETLNHV